MPNIRPKTTLFNRLLGTIDHRQYESSHEELWWTNQFDGA